MKRTLFAAALLAVTALTVDGCSSSSTSGPTVVQTTYTALGASDAVGVGSSVPCPTAGTPAMPSPPACPGGKSYVPVLGQLLASPTSAVTVIDLGISGAVIGPDIQADTALCFGAPGNIITNELPLVTINTTLVTVFTGGNDTNAIVACSATQPNPVAFINAELVKFGADYAALIAGIKSRAPNAIIIVANLPNFKLIPVGTTQPLPVQAALDMVSLAIDQNVVNPSAAVSVSAVVDNLCNAAAYNVVNFSADGFHPNDAGYQLLANAYLSQILALRTPPAPLPIASCPPYTLADKLGPIIPADAAKLRNWRY